VQVEDRHVGRVVGDAGDELVAGARGHDDLDADRGEQGDQRLPEDPAVLRHGYSHGRSILTVVPRPGAPSTSTWPRSAPIRPDSPASSAAGSAGPAGPPAAAPAQSQLISATTRRPSAPTRTSTSDARARSTAYDSASQSAE